MAIHNEIILITGATSGLGRALARALAKDNTVIACGRNLKKLEELSEENKNITACPFDVSERTAVVEIQKKLNNKFERIDRVILNAGDCIYLEQGELQTETFDAMMAVNFYGWINTLKVCKPLLSAARQPHVIGICSQVIFAPFSRAGAYGASKAAADYFLQSFAMDHLDIDVSIVYPGFIDTPLTQRNDFSMPFLLSPEDACERTLTAIEKRKARFTFPKRLRLLLLLSIFRSSWRKKIGQQG